MTKNAHRLYMSLLKWSRQKRMEVQARGLQYARRDSLQMVAHPAVLADGCQGLTVIFSQKSLF